MTLKTILAIANLSTSNIQNTAHVTKDIQMENDLTVYKQAVICLKRCEADMVTIQITNRKLYTLYDYSAIVDGRE